MQKVYGFSTIALAVILIAYSCQPLGNIGEKPNLEGSISIISTFGLMPGKVVKADISRVKYEVMPANFQWYCSTSDSFDVNDDGKWQAIEGATDIAWTIPAIGSGGDDYVGKQIYVKASDSDFNGDLRSPAEKVRVLEVEEFISGEVLLAHVGNTFEANIDGLNFVKEGNPDGLIPRFRWYVSDAGGTVFGDPVQEGSNAAFPLNDGYDGRTIRVEVSATPLIGAVYAARKYILPVPPEPGYISGEVLLLHVDDTFVANIDGVNFGEERNPKGLPPYFTWYKDNQGDGNFNEGSPIKGPVTLSEDGGNVLRLKPEYLDCTIRVKVTTPSLNGAVYAERLYSQDITNFLSGLLYLEKVAAEDAYRANISGLCYGEEGKPEDFRLSYTWYKMDVPSGSTQWTKIDGKTENKLNVKDLEDQIVRVEVKESNGKLRGALYAQRIVTGPFQKKTLEQLDAPKPLSEWINGVWVTGTRDVSQGLSVLTECLAWLNDSAQGQMYTMDGYLIEDNPRPLANRHFTITLSQDENIGPQRLGTNSGTGTKYLNIKGGNTDFPVSITIRGAPNGPTADGNSKVDLRLNATGSLFHLSGDSSVNLTLEGALTLTGRGGNDQALVNVYGSNTLTINDGVLITENINTANGGGIAVFDNATLTMKGGTISKNSADRGGGIYVNARSTVSILGDAEIINNKGGYGIYEFYDSDGNGAAITIWESADISDNTPGDFFPTTP